MSKTIKFKGACFCVLTLSLSAVFGSNEDPSEKDSRPVEARFDYNSTDNPLEPTKFILIEGEPVRLVNGMNLRGENLSGVRINNVTLIQVNFEGSNLSEADFSQTQFVQCNFRSAKLRGANASEADFPNCDFTEADLGNSRGFEITREQFLSTSNYMNKRLSYDVSRLKDIDLSNFVLDRGSGVNAQNSNLNNARILGEAFISDVTVCQLSNIDNYKKKNFSQDLHLTNTGGKKRSLSGADFSNCIIRSLYFWNYDLANVDFTDATILATVEFVGCTNLTLEQLKSTWNWKNRKFSFILVSSDVNWSNVDFSNFMFESYACLGPGSVVGSRFADAKIGAETFRFCSDITAEQIKETWNFKNRELRFHLGKTDLDWSKTDFSSFLFEWDNLNDANVTGADFTDARFYGYFNMEKCRGLTIDQIKSTWNYKNNVMTMKLPKEIADQLRAEKETNATSVSND